MSKTAEQWLAEPDLPTELGRVLTPKEEWEHDFTGEPFCIKCSGFDKFEKRVSLASACPVPDPITIDWNTAMEHFRQYAAMCFGLVRDQSFVPAMEEIYRHYNEVGGEIDREELFYWFLFKAPTEALLVAAVMVKERSKE